MSGQNCQISGVASFSLNTSSIGGIYTFCEGVTAGTFFSFSNGGVGAFSYINGISTAEAPYIVSSFNTFFPEDQSYGLAAYGNYVYNPSQVIGFPHEVFIALDVFTIGPLPGGNISYASYGNIPGVSTDGSTFVSFLGYSVFPDHTGTTNIFQTLPYNYQQGQYMFVVSAPGVTITGSTFPSQQIIVLDLAVTNLFGGQPGCPTIIAKADSGCSAYRNSSQMVTANFPFCWMACGPTLLAFTLLPGPTGYTGPAMGMTLNSSINLAAEFPGVTTPFISALGCTGTKVHITGGGTGATLIPYIIYDYTLMDSPVFVGTVNMPFMINAMPYPTQMSLFQDLSMVACSASINVIDYQDPFLPFLQQTFLGASGSSTSNVYSWTGFSQSSAYWPQNGTTFVLFVVSPLMCSNSYVVLNPAPCTDPFGQPGFCVPLGGLRLAILANSVSTFVVDQVTQYNGAVIAFQMQFNSTAVGWAGLSGATQYQVFMQQVADLPTSYINFFRLSYITGTNPPSFRLQEYTTSQTVNHCVGNDLIWWGLTEDTSCSICQWIIDAETGIPNGLMIYQGVWGSFHNCYDANPFVSATQANISPLFLQPVVVVPNPYMQAYFTIQSNPTSIVQCCMDVGGNTFLSACQQLGYYSPLNNVANSGLCNTFMTTTYCPTAIATDPNCTAYCQFISVNCDAMLQQYCFTIGTTAAVGSSTCSCFLGSQFYQNYFNHLIAFVDGLSPNQFLNPVCVYTPCSLALDGGLVPFLYKNESPSCPNIINCISVANVTNTGSFTAADVTISQSNECQQAGYTLNGNTGSTGSTAASENSILLLSIGVGIAIFIALVAIIFMVIYFSKSKTYERLYKQNSKNNINTGGGGGGSTGGIGEGGNNNAISNLKPRQPLKTPTQLRNAKPKTKAKPPPSFSDL